MNTNILDYGAKGDGTTLNTEYIQNAIDDCCKNGGGLVTIPAGKYLTGTLRLKSNVELHLEHNALLKASANLAHYNETDEYPQNTDCEKEGWCGKHLIICVEQDNVSITGTGKIEGCAESVFSGERKQTSNFWYDEGYYEIAEGAPLRPGQLVTFVESTNIKINDITFGNASCWTVFLHGCDWVQISGIKIFNCVQHANSDGIDIDTCTHVTVSDCILFTGDDSLTLRCNHARLVNKDKNECKFITVTNCILSSKCCAVRLGVGIGKIHHVVFSNIVIEEAAIGFEFMSAWGGRGNVDISDVCINNVVAQKTAYPAKLYAQNAKFERIFISNYQSECRGAIIAEVGSGEITDLTFSNITIYESDISYVYKSKLERTNF